MVQKIVVVKDGTEQNPVPLNLDASGNLSVNVGASGTTNAVTVKGVRASAANSTAHRSALSIADLIGPDTLTTPGTPDNIGTPTLPTCTDSTITEGNLATANHYVAYAIRNGFGLTKVSGITTQLVVAGKSIRVAIPTAWRVTDADVVYEFFLSTSATAPAHVTSFTAAQLAAGATVRCYDYTTVETPVLGGEGGAAWTCDIGIVGTGVATTNQRFQQSNAYKPGTIVAANTAGYNNVDLYVDAQCTYTYSATTQTLTLIPLILNDKQATNYHVGAPIEMLISQKLGQSYRQMWNLTTNGASMMILVASIANVTVNRIDITPTSVV